MMNVNFCEIDEDLKERCDIKAGSKEAKLYAQWQAMGV